ncbi:MAG: glycosyltransferase family 2 protein, partial [Gammaproteobacteria bacterium]|nr:glycosyltransferase family 2 protein [Gammaproteobacteria bacterium]
MDKKTLIAKIHQWLHSKYQGHFEDAITDPSRSASLFSDEQLELHGNTLAQSHQLAKKLTKRVLLRRLADSEKVLINVCRILTNSTAAGNYLSPAGEWLLDNYALIEEQIYTIKRHLPKGCEKDLPQLVSSHAQGRYPRIYGIAVQIIGHGDGHWCIDSLSRFVNAYQQVTPLTLGELWVFPMMLCLAIIEHLSCVSKQVALNCNAHNLADHWADKIIEVAADDSNKLVFVIADMARCELSMTDTFIAELTRRLQGAALALPLSWVDLQLAEKGVTLEELLQTENKRQAVNQLTISNSIASLRRISELDWREFVELMSVVEHALYKDPTATYSHMDFTTRDRYCNVIQSLANASSKSEIDVAEAAIQLATAAADNDKSNAIDHAKRSHVGYYFIDAGLPQLQQALNVHCSLWEKLQRWIGQHSLLFYLGFITLIALGVTGGLLFKANQIPINALWLVILALAIVLCASQLAVTLVNWGAMLLVKPHPLPKMNFKKGVPLEFRSLVVVPTMLGGVAQIASLVDALEVHFLGNRDNYLHFALLTDFNDAPHEHMPNDAALLALAQERIMALNRLYCRENEDIFFLLHRPRCWNASEQVWMGYERKRGKLSALNDLLRGNIQTHFSLIVGRTDILASVKYVITLDTDTQLPRDCARHLIGAMAHPLNRPSYNVVTRQVIAGYGILQPRIAEIFPENGPTCYLSLCSGEMGIDPYTRMVSDVYQDLFNEGSFIGKGIYDVDLFQEVLGQCFPENRILSHDLLEGCYLHSGLITDAPLYEKSPGSYLVDVKRRIRWIRGDWQIMAWLLPRVPGHDGQRVANPLSALSKWKLFDNLRRSLVAVSLLVFFAIVWTVLPATYFWLSAMWSIVLLPSILMTIFGLARKSDSMLLGQHLFSSLQAAYRRFSQLVLYLACLPHEAWYSIGAIMRTCWRLMVSHQHLLEWTPSDQVERDFHDRPSEWFAKMWMGPAAAFIMLVGLLVSHKFLSLLFASPLLLFWAASP